MRTWCCRITIAGDPGVHARSIADRQAPLESRSRPSDVIIDSALRYAGDMRGGLPRDMERGESSFPHRNGFALRRDLRDPKLLEHLRSAFRRTRASAARPASTGAGSGSTPSCSGTCPRTAAARILDAGSGYRFFAPLLAKRGFEVDACDLDASIGPKYDEIAARYDIAIEFTQQDLSKMTYADDTLRLHLLHQRARAQPRPDEIVREFRRCLKPGGTLLLTFDVSVHGDRDIPVAAARRSDPPARTTSSIPPRRSSASELISRTALARAEEVLRTEWFRRHRPELLPWRFISRASLQNLLRGRIGRPFFDLAVVIGHGCTDEVAPRRRPPWPARCARRVVRGHHLTREARGEDSAECEDHGDLDGAHRGRGDHGVAEREARQMGEPAHQEFPDADRARRDRDQAGQHRGGGEDDAGREAAPRRRPWRRRFGGWPPSRAGCRPEAGRRRATRGGSPRADCASQASQRPKPAGSSRRSAGTSAPPRAVMTAKPAPTIPVSCSGNVEREGRETDGSVGRHDHDQQRHLAHRERADTAASARASGRRPWRPFPPTAAGSW